MNRNMLYQTLIRAARAEKVECEVPFGFKVKVLESVRGLSSDPTMCLWRCSAAVLWKAAYSSAGVAVAVCLTALVFGVDENRSPGPRSLPAEESVVVADVSTGAGDEIAGVLIEDLEPGDPF